MAKSTVFALGAAFIVTGLLSYAGMSGGISWIAGGIAAIIVGWATMNMK